MVMNAQNGRIRFRDSDMDYIRFGAGERVLIMLPGLGDGLRTIRGMAVPCALMYRAFGKEYTVYTFSRKNHMAPGYSTRDMARDVKRAMDGLGIENADVFGVSMGGMLAQHLAADFPDRVGSLVLTVTSARPNPILTESVSLWMDQARRGDHAGLMDSNLRLIYSEAYYQRNRWAAPLMGAMMRPDSYDRFLIMAQACLDHDAFDRLKDIRCPTLVIGGERDNTLGGDASREIAAEIPGSALRMYAQWGHGVYEEEKEFNRVVLDFLRENRR